MALSKLPRCSRKIPPFSAPFRAPSVNPIPFYIPFSEIAFRGAEKMIRKKLRGGPHKAATKTTFGIIARS